MFETKYGIGDSLKDTVTGFEGIVLGITLYATGCLHYGLCSQELKNEGTPNDWEWFDQSRLVLVESKKVKFDIPVGTTSGPEPNAPQMC